MPAGDGFSVYGSHSEALRGMSFHSSFFLKKFRELFEDSLVWNFAFLMGSFIWFCLSCSFPSVRGIETAIYKFDKDFDECFDIARDVTVIVESNVV